MKKVLLMLMICVSLNEAYSQGFYSYANTIDSLYPNDTVEGGKKAKVERIRRRWNGQFDNNGNFTQARQNFYSFTQGLANFRTQTTNCNSYSPVWTEVGPTMEANNPTNLIGAGQINRMTFHPSYNGTGTGTNQQTIFGLSAYGGIWKSIDNGDNWTRLNTDIYIPYSSMGVLVIDPVSPNRMYVTTGHPSGASVGPYGYFTIGIYGTDDGGTTWQQINTGLSTTNLINTGTIFNLQIDPTNHSNLICTTTDGVFYSTNAHLPLGNITWTKDLNFTFPDSKIVGLTHNASTNEWFVSGKHIYATTNPFTLSHTWNILTGTGSGIDLTSGHYPGMPTEAILSIKVMNSPFHANTIFALIFSASPGSNGYITILKLTGLSSSNLFTNLTHKYSFALDGITHYDMMAFVPSPHIGEFYYGSTDYGHYSHSNNILTETYGNGSYGSDGGTHHADVHGLYIHPSQPGKLWLCGDGGISSAAVISNDHNGTGFTYKNKGIQSQVLWAYDDSEQDPDYRLAALQDNGTQYTGGAAGNVWKTAVFAGDGYNASIIDIDNTDAGVRGNTSWAKFNYQTGTYCNFNTSGPWSGGGLYYKHNPDNITERLRDGYQINKFVGSPCASPANNYGGFAWSWDDDITFTYNGQTINYALTEIFEMAYGKISNNTCAYAVTKASPGKPSVVIKSVNGVNTPPLYTDYFGAANSQPITNALYNAVHAEVPILASLGPPAISDICTLPCDGNKVWVSSSGLINNFKVWKTADGGATWTNADPLGKFNNIPVFEVEAMNDALETVFAGTLDGVYFTNNTMAGNWCRYGASPSVQVVSLKINYIKHKLIVGTFGRGAFEVSLPVDAPTVVSTTQTWSTVHNFPTSSVIVQAGKTLTIQNTTCYFGPSSRIYVEAGAKLVINNSTLTSDACGSHQWKGIELQGNINQKQVLSGPYYPNHGWCVMTNNATIRNAEVGIKNTATVNGDGVTLDPTKLGGGIIQCTNAKFLNCTVGAKFVAYINKNALNQPINDKSFFTTTLFHTDATLAPVVYKPNTHLLMSGTRGIGITSNTFKNLTPGSYTIPKRGNGIVANDATFATNTPCITFNSTTGECSVYGTRNTFENLFYGVDAGASVATIIDNVSVCTFTNNHRGIVFRGTTQNTAYRNNIAIGEAYSEDSGTGTGIVTFLPYGIYLDVCDAYNVSENVFTDASGTSPDTDYGIIVNNTGLNSNVLKKNTFSNTAYGIQAQEENYDLQLKCNKFTASTIKNADVKIMGLLMQGSIAQQQGGCVPGDATALPGNEFSHTCSAAQDLGTNSNVLYQVTYNTRSTPNVELPQTGCYNTTDYFVNLCTNSGAGEVCPPPTGGGIDGMRMAKSNPESELNEMGQLIAAKQQLLDEGNTTQLRNDIASSSDENALKQNLLQKGPYLSDQVLLDFIHHTPAYSAATLKEVLINNSPLQPNVMEAVNGSNLASKVKSQIGTYQSGMSQRTSLEKEIRYLKTSRVLLYNTIINTVLNDTLNPSVYDTLYTKLNFSISPQSRYLYISALMDQGKYTQAQAELSTLRQSGEKAENCDYYEALISLKQQQNGAQAYKSNAGISSKIDPLLTQWPLGKSVNANVLHSSLFGTKYREKVYIEEAIARQERLALENEAKTSVAEGNFQVLAFPNPAQNEIAFMIDGNETTNECNITIYDVNGKLMTNFMIKENKTPKIISLNEYSSGIYFYKAVSGIKVIQNKLVIIK